MQITTPAIGSSSPSVALPGSPPQAACCGPEPSDPVDVFVPAGADRSEAHRTELGQALWDRYLDGTLELLPVQVSGRNDGADARSNIADTALGKQAKRSSYENAPGGRVPLTFSLLEGMNDLCEDFSFRVTAIAGGSHSSKSRHYLGVGMDVDRIDGQQVDKNHPRFREFMERARALGATEVLGPGAKGHNYHIHVAWPRDAQVGLA